MIKRSKVKEMERWVATHVVGKTISSISDRV